MKHYELMYIIPLKIGQDDNNEIQEKVRQMLIAEGAKISLEENLGKRKLAYHINHIRHGNYVVMEFDLDPAKVGKVQSWLRLSGELLRFQIINKKIKSPEKMAREQALQEKLMKKQIKITSEEKQETITDDEEAPASTPTTPTELADLDKKLEQILEQEIVK